MAFIKVFCIRAIFAFLAIWLILLFSNVDQRVTDIVRLKDWRNNDEVRNRDEVFKRAEVRKREEDPTRSFFIRQNGKYWILYNYIQARRVFYGNESITYTTHGEYAFLDNLEAIVQRWRAPISIALFACDSDFEATLNSIRYLRSCSSAADLIKDLVTFHIFFHEHHMPGFVPKTEDEILQSIDCEQLTLIFEFSKQKHLTYRASKNILYPINVARNIARHEATTYYVFPLDIELLPSVNFVREFLEMVGPMKLAQQKSVFVVAIFEMKLGYDLPNSKTELQRMLRKQIAIPFHRKFAYKYHAIPDLKEWINRTEPEHMEVFKVINREEESWEPFYVTINKDEPYYDERFSWEGQYDKRIQADLLGILNYDFIILEKAFLMHRPGIKVVTRPDKRIHGLRVKTGLAARSVYRKQLLELYGAKNQKVEDVKANATNEQNAESVVDFWDLPDNSSKQGIAKEMPNEDTKEIA